MMLTYKTLLKFFSIIYKTEKISSARLLQYRKLNTSWLKAIDNTYTKFRIIHQTYSLIYKNFKYDIDYDSKSYERMILQKYIIKNNNTYWDIKVPIIDIVEYPELEDQYIVDKINMPDAYYVLLRIYEKYPSTDIKLFNSDVLLDYFQAQYTWLENIIFSMIDDSYFDNILLFTPILYNKEKKLLICHVNVIDTFLEDDFPFDNERFYIIQYEYDEDLFEQLISLSNTIKTSDETIFNPKNIASQLVSFKSAFLELLD